MSRTPKIPITGLRAIMRAGVLWRVARKMFSPRALCQTYGVTGNVIAFIQKGGKFKSYPRAYDDASADSAAAQADSTPAPRLLEDAFLDDLASSADGRARLLEAVCIGLQRQRGADGRLFLVNTDLLINAYRMEEICRPDTSSSPSPSPSC